MSAYAASSRGLFSRVGEWADNYKGDIIFLSLIGGVVGIGVRGAIYFDNNEGKVRSEEVVESFPIGFGNEFVISRRNLKVETDDYGWEIKSLDGRTFLSGHSIDYPTINAAFFAEKADSLTNELERKISETAVEE